MTDHGKPCMHMQNSSRAVFCVQRQFVLILSAKLEILFVAMSREMDFLKRKSEVLREEMHGDVEASSSVALPSQASSSVALPSHLSSEQLDLIEANRKKALAKKAAKMLRQKSFDRMRTQEFPRPTTVVDWDSCTQETVPVFGSGCVHFVSGEFMW